MVVKVNVCLPKEVLEKLDDAARESGASRSAFLARAVTHYLEEKEVERKLQKRLRAAARIDEFRDQFGGWDGTAEVLLWRDRH